jgi:hypothetical protein
MTHKPLTMDRLGGIATRIQYDLHASADDIKADLEDLLREAMYWREAVKKFYLDNDGGNCPFCDAWHKPDCPWLLAQEGE